MVFEMISKELYDATGYNYKNLRGINLKMGDMIQAYRELSLKQLGITRPTNKEFFLSIKGKDNYYFYVTLTPDFEAWVWDNTFNEGRTRKPSIEIIQQLGNLNKHGTKNKYLPTYLIAINEALVTGGAWIRYIPTHDVKEFFKIGAKRL